MLLVLLGVVFGLLLHSTFCFQEAVYSTFCFWEALYSTAIHEVMIGMSNGYIMIGASLNVMNAQLMMAREIVKLLNPLPLFNPLYHSALCSLHRLTTHPSLPQNHPKFLLANTQSFLLAPLSASSKPSHLSFPTFRQRYMYRWLHPPLPLSVYPTTHMRPRHRLIRLDETSDTTLIHSTLVYFQPLHHSHLAVVSWVTCSGYVLFHTYLIYLFL
jgi:hypothetical protein